jgi:hypothetical protein
VATPDIGTTISEGYSRGFAQLSATIGSAAVPAGIVGVIAGVLGELQARTTDVEVGFASVFNSGQDLDRGDLAVSNLLGAANTLAGLFIGTAAIAIFAGATHRARHGAAGDVPEPGNMFAALQSMVPLLMPKLGLLALLSVAGLLASAVSFVLGGLVSLAAGVALIIFAVRWIYAPVIIGAGEGERDAGYARSEAVVAGSWWGTFGVLIVVSLAIGLPVVIVAGIVGGVLPGAFLTAFATAAIGALGYYTLGAAALDSAWTQVEGASLDEPADVQPTTMPPTAPAPVVPVAPDAIAPHVQPETPRNDGPFV